jgi:ABC-type phosphate transport system substrate-binding protein
MVARGFAVFLSALVAGFAAGPSAADGPDIHLSPDMRLSPDIHLGGWGFSRPGPELDMPAEWLARPLARPLGVDVALALDQQLYPAILPLIERYAAAHGIKVALQEGTCGIAAGALSDKAADITGMCCPPGDLDRLPGVRFHTLGIAAVAFIVHPVNRLKDLTLSEVRRIFAGQTKSWTDLPMSGFAPGPGTAVEAVIRLHCQTRPGDWRLLLSRPDDFSPASVEVPAVTDMILEVLRHPTAIGYETLWHVASNAATGRVRALRIDGVAPDDGPALAAGRYPVYRVFNITTWDGPSASPAARGLADWLVAHAADMAPGFGIVPHGELRARGWEFEGDELVGAPR